MIDVSYDICENLINKLSNDDMIKDFCNKNFNKNASFFLGVDEKKPPSQEDLPLILLYPEATSNPDDRAISSKIFVGTAIENDACTTSNKITKMAGFKTIEQFENLVFMCIENALNEFNQNHSILSQGEGRYLCFYPEFHSQRMLEIISARS